MAAVVPSQTLLVNIIHSSILLRWCFICFFRLSGVYTRVQKYMDWITDKMESSAGLERGLIQDEHTPVTKCPSLMCNGICLPKEKVCNFQVCTTLTQMMSKYREKAGFIVVVLIPFFFFLRLIVSVDTTKFTVGILPENTDFWRILVKMPRTEVSVLATAPVSRDQ